MDGGQDEVCYLRVRCCEKGDDGDRGAGGGVVGLVVEYYAGSRECWCWWHLSEGLEQKAYISVTDSRCRGVSSATLTQSP